MDRVRYTVNNGIIEELHRVVVHKFAVDNNYIRQMQEWRESEKGQFVLKHAHRHYWKLYNGYCYAQIAELENKKLSEFYLRFGKVNM